MKLNNGKRIVLSGNLATTNPEALFYAAKNAIGILISNDVMIKDELNTGALRRILPSTTTDETTVYAYYPKLDYQHTRTKLFLDYLKNRLLDE